MNFDKFFKQNTPFSKFFLTFCELYLYPGMTKAMSQAPQISGDVMVRMSANHKQYLG